MGTVEKDRETDKRTRAIINGAERSAGQPGSEPTGAAARFPTSQRRRAGRAGRGSEALVAWSVYFEGQGMPPQVWGRGRIKGEAALSSLYLVADAPEALVTRSYYCAPRTEGGPRLHPRGREHPRPGFTPQDRCSRLPPRAAEIPPPSPAGKSPTPELGRGSGRVGAHPGP